MTDATIMIVRDDAGERCVVTHADPVIWVASDLWAEFTSPDRLPMLPGSAELDGDVLTFGTKGEGLGKLTYRRIGDAATDHGERFIVCERVKP